MYDDSNSISTRISAQKLKRFDGEHLQTEADFNVC